MALDPMWRKRMGEIDVRIAMAVEEERKRIGCWIEESALDGVLFEAVDMLCNAKVPWDNEG